MKLLFIDIDGTLTIPGENKPTKNVLEALDKARANGHKLILCTGRNMGMLAPLLQYGFDGVVASAGGHVCIGDEVIYDCPMSVEQQNTAIKALHDNGVFVTVESVDHAWGDEALEDFLRKAQQGNSEIERWRKALTENLGVLPMKEYDGSAIYKIVYMCRHKEQLAEAERLLGDSFKFVLQEGIGGQGILDGEMINRKFNKGQGVRQVAAHFGVSITDTIGFGDSMNDVEMIDTVGISVCMENGSQALKERSDIICPPVQEDGLVRAFAELHLI